jgi:hypothetical protein
VVHLEACILSGGTTRRVVAEVKTVYRAEQLASRGDAMAREQEY